MAFEIINAPVALKEQLIELCLETYRTHREAAPQNWASNYFELAIKPAIESAFKNKVGAALAESPTIFAAMKDNTFAGYYRLSALPTDPKVDYFAVEIVDICVVPEFRRQGIATAMIAHAKTLAAEHDWDSLEATVADMNAGSRHIFEAEGFTVASRKLFFGPNRAARDIPVPLIKARFNWAHWVNVALLVSTVAIFILLYFK